MAINDMVKYLANPSKDKTVDTTPHYVNCTADAIDLTLEEAEKRVMNESKAIQDLTQLATQRKRDGVELH
eukprot:9784523-Lingulodinium_polyedra.AAC.1